MTSCTIELRLSEHGRSLNARVKDAMTELTGDPGARLFVLRHGTGEHVAENFTIPAGFSTDAGRRPLDRGDLGDVIVTLNDDGTASVTYQALATASMIERFFSERPEGDHRARIYHAGSAHAWEAAWEAARSAWLFELPDHLLGPAASVLGRGHLLEAGCSVDSLLAKPERLCALLEQVAALAPLPRRAFDSLCAASTGMLVADLFAAVDGATT